MPLPDKRCFAGKEKAQQANPFRRLPKALGGNFRVQNRRHAPMYSKQSEKPCLFPCGAAGICEGGVLFPRKRNNLNFCKQIYVMVESTSSISTRNKLCGEESVSSAQLVLDFGALASSFLRSLFTCTDSFDVNFCRIPCFLSPGTRTTNTTESLRLKCRFSCGTRAHQFCKETSDFTSNENGDCFTHRKI